MTTKIPTPIIDKNGRRTTVHKNPQRASDGRVKNLGKTPEVPVALSAGTSAEHLRRTILDGMTKAERRATTIKNVETKFQMENDEPVLYIKAFAKNLKRAGAVDAVYRGEETITALIEGVLQRNPHIEDVDFGMLEGNEGRIVDGFQVRFGNGGYTALPARISISAHGTRGDGGIWAQFIPDGTKLIASGIENILRLDES